MKKIVSIFLIVLVFVTVPFLNIVIAANPTPTVSIYPPSSGVVKVGSSVSYRVVANNATSFNISPSDVGIARGVTASVSVQNVSNNEKLIVLSNVQGSVGASGYIAIKSGVAKNGSVSSKTTPASPAFTIIEADKPVEPEKPPVKPSEPSKPDDGNNNNNNNNNNTNNNNNNSNNNNNNTNSNTNTNNTEKPNEGTENENPDKKDTKAPTISIAKAAPVSVKVDGEVVFDVEYSDDTGIDKITLKESDIILYGFTANIKISGEGNNRKITLSNIKGDLGGLKYIVIAPKTATDKAGNTIKDNTKSGYFKLVDDTTNSKPDDWVQNPNTGR